MQNIKYLSNLSTQDISGKSILLRVDLNLPMQAGRVSDKTRLTEIKLTVTFLTNKGARVLLISHFGRPAGEFDKKYSLEQIVRVVSEELGKNVTFCNNLLDASRTLSTLKNGEIAILENLRFYKEEELNDDDFAKKIARYGDIYVNDAFGCSHRKHASIDAITKFIPSYCGLLMEKELKYLQQITSNESKAFFLVGGSKVSTKINLLESLSTKARCIVIGGGMANTFLYAKGHDIGRSMCETDFAEKALQILRECEKNNCDVILPIDVVVAKSIDGTGTHRTCDITDIKHDEIIVDVGQKTIELISQKIEQGSQSNQLVVWNGPFGIFETKPFNIGTDMIAKVISDLTSAKKIESVVGGGDVVCAINNSGLASSFSYVSTGGGSFLEHIEKGSLVGVEALRSSKI